MPIASDRIEPYNHIKRIQSPAEAPLEVHINHEYMHTFMHVCIYTWMHFYMYTHMYTYAHVYMYTSMCDGGRLSSTPSFTRGLRPVFSTSASHKPFLDVLWVQSRFVQVSSSSSHIKGFRCPGKVGTLYTATCLIRFFVKQLVKQPSVKLQSMNRGRTLVQA